ncbi:GNAT family N-acetyltransferase [Flavobacterium psychrotrophum]|uniref:GNAT family N-acetyltransferase n=1 Tax=Flavobacterium psychrotrophum TaxID=2294119 RepID=UPI000E3223B8|nr:GNAT family N-acetyltransferase [Flavobacterium psychrotrophum]
MNIEYIVKPFDGLTIKELYKILRLRSEVFVVEQNCPYQDMDNKDLKGYHLMCYADGELAGYTRLLPQGISYQEASIGRVVIAPAYRGLKLGKQLMEESITACTSLFQNPAMRISAQAHLQGFYNSLGFEPVGEPYDEDGIPHIEMLLKQATPVPVDCSISG